MKQKKSKFQKSDQKFQNLREKISNTFVDHDFYEIVDQFPLFAGLHTIGNKLFTYELIKSTLDIPGHIVEFGCWKGSNLVYMAKLLELMAPHSSKKVFGFDNFTGLPKPTEVDGKFAEKSTGKYSGDKDKLLACIEAFELDGNVELIIGDATETIPNFVSQNKEFLVSFAYLDFDLYEGTAAALELLEDCLSIGGIIAFDEALDTRWPGETLALKEFLKNSKNQYKPMMNKLSRQPTFALQRLS